MNDDFFIDRAERRQLSTRLRELADWALPALDDAVCRQVSFGNQQAKVRGSDDDQIPFNESASLVAHEVRDTLRAWVLHVCTIRHRPWPGEQRAVAYARWLDRHIIDLALTETASDGADEITDAWRRVKRAIDRPESPQFIGPCQADTALCDGLYCPKGKIEFDCQTCGITIDIPAVRAATEATMAEHLFTKTELRAALLRFATNPVSRHRIDGWIRRGRLPDKAGKYKLADAVALLDDHELQPDALRMRHIGAVLDTGDASPGVG